MKQTEFRYRLTGYRALTGWLPESPDNWWDELAQIGLVHCLRSTDSIEAHFDFAIIDRHPANEPDARQLVEAKMAELGLFFEYLGDSRDELNLRLSVTELGHLERLVAKLAG